MKTSTLAGGVALLAALWISIPLQTASGDGPSDPKSEVGAHPIGDVGAPPPMYTEAEVVVRLKSGATPAEFLGGGSVLGVTRTLLHSTSFLINLTPGADVDSAAAALGALTSVVYAHPNYLFNQLHPVQGSYPFPDLNAVGDYEEQQAALSLQLLSAHSLATGAGVKVGVIDVGVDFDHTLLSSSSTSGHDFVDGDDSAFDEPGGLHSGHGTFVAGLVHLAAPDAQLVAYRVADAEGYGDGFTLAQAIERAVDDGCDIINLSLVLLKRHLAVRDALLYAESNGVLVVAAAGNQAQNGAVYPAAEATVMAVGALDPLLGRAPFSSYGAHLSVCAPGIELYSSYRDDYFAWWSGTSFSAPLVAGTAALLAETASAWAGSMIRHVLEFTASDITSQNPGLEGLLGHGQIDPVAALNYAASPEWATVTPDTLYFLHQIGRLYLIPPFAYAVVQSSNAPAQYYGEVTGPDSIFSWVVSRRHLTGDTVIIAISPWEVPGTYVNTVLFHVDGVAEPARLTVQLEVQGPDPNTPTAWVVPNALYFQAQLGDASPLSKAVLLQSSPDPASFSGSVLPGGIQLTTLSNPSGVTPDSVTITVEPARAFSAGMYEDTVVFQVDGVSFPVPLFVLVNITDSTVVSTDSAWAFPGTIHFSTMLGVVPTVMLSEWVHVFSFNAPATYVASVSGTDPIFVVFLDSIGVTNDSMEILVSPAGWPVGSYLNTVRFYVNGVANPAAVNVWFDVFPDSTGGGPDTAAVVPSVLYAEAAAGSTNPITHWVMLYSTNAPALYFGYVLSWPSFVSLPDSVGTTNDSVRIVIDPSGLAAGVHRDTVLFEVLGTDQPVRLPVELLVSAGDTLPPAVSVYNYPNPFNPETQIVFALPAQARVTLSIFNVLGEYVATLVDRDLPSGEQRFTWDGHTKAGTWASSGVYFYRLTVDDIVRTGKMMMVR